MMDTFWPIRKLGDFIVQKRENVDPRNFPKETFEHYSVPSHSTGSPIQSTGSEIKSTKYILKTGDVLLSKINPHLNRTWVVGESEHRMIGSGEWIQFRNTGEIEPRYLAYFLSTQKFVDHCVANVSGVGGSLRRTKKSAIENYPLPLPPITEQIRIVSILNPILENIEFNTTQTRTQIQIAEELFQSTLNSIFFKGGENWIDTTIGDEVDFLAGFAFKSSEYTDDHNGIKLLRGDNIIQGKLRWDGVKRWPKDEYEDYVKFALQEHDVVLAMDRPWVSAGLKFSSISQDDLPCLQVQRTARMRAGENLHWRFLFYLIGSHNFIQEMLGGQTGIGVPHISGKQIQSFSFARPSIDEQITIANLLDLLSNNTRLVKQISHRKLNNYSELQQSVLQDALEGKLTGGIAA